MFRIRHKVAFRGARSKLRTVAGIATVAVLALGVTGCHSDSGAAGASSASPAPKNVPAAAPAPPSPKDALAAAAAELEKTRYTFKLGSMREMGGIISGVVDPQSKSSQINLTATDAELGKGAISLRSVDSQAWLKLGGKFSKAARQSAGYRQNAIYLGKWLHLEPAKIKGTFVAEMRQVGEDVGTAGQVLANSLDVRKAGSDTYTGRFDMSKAKKLATLAEPNASASPVPFEAKLDAQGRLTQLTVKDPKQDKSSAPTDVVIRFSDYSSAEQLQQPPANQVVEAPAAIYEFMT